MLLKNIQEAPNTQVKLEAASSQAYLAMVNHKPELIGEAKAICTCSTGILCRAVAMAAKKHSADADYGMLGCNDFEIGSAAAPKEIAASPKFQNNKYLVQQQFTGFEPGMLFKSSRKVRNGRIAQ